MFEYKINRRKSRRIYVGKVAIGDGAPISVQSMTNTPTKDVAATVQQIKSLEAVGADIVRVSCPDEDSTLGLKEIVKQVNVPIVADIHFHYKRAIEAAEAGAACLRINPGNIGSQERVREVIKAAKDHNCSIRIGVNGGSLDKALLQKYGEPCPEAMVESALQHAKILEDNDFFNFKISVKSSDTLMTMEAYRQLAEQCDYPLHLGITEAGGLRAGTVKSAMGIGGLLMQGIGDTLRVSLTADVTEEIKAGFEILRTLGLRYHGIRFVSCPTCARRGIDVEKTIKILEQRLEHIQEPLKIAVMGCVVNGPGEASGADIGVCGGGNGKALLFLKGKQQEVIDAENAADIVAKLAEEMVANKNK
ncbi:MAG: flavodoxin-dependent (E)-4-hydroxy-3-methylbut-2-enyl-diphosphate synthase [Alphaproteobacteria bacterium]|nr:flavodoxin-dependent (E)-4-hydroxy-3-methylbut-2-enyl-diphosphate synthase [Alphaproteobacteria bacterium]